MQNEMRKQFDKSLGLRIKTRRLELNKTQSWLAKKIGVTFQQVQKYEKGSNGISTPKLMKASKYLKFSFKWMFSESPVKR